MKSAALETLIVSASPLEAIPSVVAKEEHVEERNNVASAKLLGVFRLSGRASAPRAQDCYGAAFLFGLWPVSFCWALYCPPDIAHSTSKNRANVVHCVPSLKNGSSTDLQNIQLGLGQVSLHAAIAPARGQSAGWPPPDFVPPARFNPTQPRKHGKTHKKHQRTTGHKIHNTHCPGSASAVASSQAPQHTHDNHR